MLRASAGCSRRCRCRGRSSTRTGAWLLLLGLCSALPLDARHRRLLRRHVADRPLVVGHPLRVALIPGHRRKRSRHDAVRVAAAVRAGHRHVRLAQRPQGLEHPVALLAVVLVQGHRLDSEGLLLPPQALPERGPGHVALPPADAGAAGGGPPPGPGGAAAPAAGAPRTRPRSRRAPACRRCSCGGGAPPPAPAPAAWSPALLRYTMPAAGAARP